MKILLQAFKFINAAFRLLWLCFHFIHGLMLLVAYRLRWGKQWFYQAKGAAAIQKWFKRGSQVLGLKIQLSGTSSQKSTVLVSNHISWLDIVAVAASTPVTFVSKADLRSWPVVGKLAKSSGTVFIKRGSLFSMHQTMNQIVDVLEKNRSIIFFPEGTTTRGEDVKRFNSGLFETAYKAGRAVQPVAISYYRHCQPDYQVAPYVDDDHFLKHLWTLLFTGKLHVQIDFLDEIEPRKFCRRTMAATCHARIREVLMTSAMISSDYPLALKDAEHILLS